MCSYTRQCTPVARGSRPHPEHRKARKEFAEEGEGMCQGFGPCQLSRRVMLPRKNWLANASTNRPVGSSQEESEFAEQDLRLVRGHGARPARRWVALVHKV